MRAIRSCRSFSAPWARRSASVRCSGPCPDCCSRAAGSPAGACGPVKIAPMRRASTLSQYLIERQRAGKINAVLRLLSETIARACKAISTRVNKGALGGGGASLGVENVQGETQKALDVLSNEILMEANEWGGN